MLKDIDVILSDGEGYTAEFKENPEKALREALVNAVCHRNYSEEGARVTVEVFDNRVAIISPGGLPNGITYANFGYVSVTRNPIIANLLHRIDYIERMGTGINRIRSAMQEAGLEPPVFENGSFFKVLFKRKLSDSNEADNEADSKTENRAPSGRAEDKAYYGRAENKAHYGKAENEGFTQADTEADNKAEKMIIKTIKNEPTITRKQLQDFTGFSGSKTYRTIASLKNQNKLIRHGSDRAGFWQVNE